jgi:hypothetical protein
LCFDISPRGVVYLRYLPPLLHHISRVHIYDSCWEFGSFSLSKENFRPGGEVANVE